MNSRLVLATIVVAAVGFAVSAQEAVAAPNANSCADNPVRARRELPCRHHHCRLLEHRGPLCDRPGRPWRGIRF